MKFAVVGCVKCRRMMVADLSFASKSCQCGHKIVLAKASLLATSNSAEEAGELLRGFLSKQNSGFVGADKMKESGVLDKMQK